MRRKDLGLCRIQVGHMVAGHKLADHMLAVHKIAVVVVGLQNLAGQKVVQEEQGKKAAGSWVG